MGWENKPPVGFYLKTTDWIEEFISDKKTFDKYYKEIYPNETCYLSIPKGIDPPKWSQQCHFPGAFVAVIPNGRVWGANGNIISPNNKLLWDLSFQWTPPEQNEVFSQKELFPPEDTEETIAVIAHKGHWNYFHWFYDIISRIHLLRKSGITIEKYVVNGSLPWSFQFDTLIQLGIPKENIIQTNGNFHLKAKRLIVPSIPWRSGYPKWISDFLRSGYLKNNINRKEIKGFERIYISREDASVRKVLNEDVVMGILRKYGFRKIVLSSFSFKDQVNLFHSAKCIVSPHGAGLTNLTFSNPGTKMIEFSVESFSSNIFWKVSNHIKADYYYMTCESGVPRATKPGYDNIVIDAGKLLKVLECAGF